jgi:hypothetical protein
MRYGSRCVLQGFRCSNGFDLATLWQRAAEADAAELDTSLPRNVTLFESCQRDVPKVPFGRIQKSDRANNECSYRTLSR